MDPESSFSDRKCRQKARAWTLALLLSALGALAPPSSRAEELTSTPAHGMRQMIFSRSSYWWRDSIDFAGNLWPSAWSTTSYASAWGSHWSAPPTNAVDAVVFRPIYDGTSGLQKNMRQIVFSGPQLWQRDSNDQAGNDWPSSWTSYTLTAVWGGQTNAPPTDRIEGVVIRPLVDDYGDVRGMRQIFYARGFVHQRDSRDRGGLDWPASWVKTSFATAWGGQTNAPPTDRVDAIEIRPVFNAWGDIARFRQVFMTGGYVYSRDSTDVRGLQWPTTWTKTAYSASWGGHQNAPPTDRVDALAIFPRDLQDRRYEVKVVSNYGYVMAEGGGGGYYSGTAITANSGNPGTWETFTLRDLNGGSLQNGDYVYLQTANGTFVNPVGGGGREVLAYNWFPVVDPNPWSTLRIFRRDGRTTEIGTGIDIGFQTIWGWWLNNQSCAGTGNRVDGLGNSLGTCQTFRLAQKKKRPDREPGKPKPPVPGGECLYRSDCENGLICNSVYFCARCTSNSQCETGEICRILPGQVDGLCVKQHRRDMACEATVWCDEISALCPHTSEDWAKAEIYKYPWELARGGVTPSGICVSNDTVGLHSNWYISDTGTFSGSTWECNCCERGNDSRIHLRYGARPN